MFPTAIIAFSNSSIVKASIVCGRFIHQTAFESTLTEPAALESTADVLLSCTIVQPSDLDLNVSGQAQGATLLDNPDAHQHEAAGPSESTQTFMNGHLDTGDLEDSWNHRYNADEYPLTASQQPEEIEVLSNMATREQQQQRRQNETARPVFPNDLHAPEGRSMPLTNMQNPPTLQRAQARASIIHGAAAPESSTIDEQAARTLLMIFHSDNVDDTHLGDPTGTLSKNVDITNSRDFEEAMEDQPAMSTRDSYAGPPVTAQHPTDSNAAGHRLRYGVR
ncbi:hypothetical protein G7Y79_00026g058640 [Physcia stellaris]|nr:hypothetical protein G7Y79_00026g058640 [Physcia stellaris]